LEKWFLPKYLQLEEQFKFLMGSYKLWEETQLADDSKRSAPWMPLTVRYLKEFGFPLLHKHLSIDLHRHSIQTNIINLHVSEDHAIPHDSMTMKECCGLILDESCNWKVIGLPPTRIYHHEEKQEQGVVWNTCTVYERKFDGYQAVLYNYQGTLQL
jgi:hypothetical protein